MKFGPNIYGPQRKNPKHLDYFKIVLSANYFQSYQGFFDGFTQT